MRVAHGVVFRRVVYSSVLMKAWEVEVKLGDTGGLWRRGCVCERVVMCGRAIDDKSHILRV